MSFPDNYIEQPKPCISGWPHRFSSMGHPLAHRCIYCHRPKWVEQRPDPEPYIASSLPSVR